MPPSHEPTEPPERFIDYLRFISDMLGGDILPLDTHTHALTSLVAQRAIDYELMREIVAEILKHNAVFHKNDAIEAYPTLDALGIMRGQLMQHKGDVNQICLLDRMGELTVSYFNLRIPPRIRSQPYSQARIYSIK